MGRAWRGTALVAIACAMQVAPAAAAEIDIGSPNGPLTHVRISDDLNCAVNVQGDAAGAFFDDTACGTLVSVDGVLYGPEVIPQGTPAARTPFTKVSQSEVVSPISTPGQRSVQTQVRAGPVDVYQLDTYRAGESLYHTTIRVTPWQTQGRQVIVYHAGDCFLAGQDEGYGALDTATGAVACKATNEPSSRSMQFVPVSAGSTAFEGRYLTMWERIGARNPFPDTCQCTEDDVDNAMGVSWQSFVPLGFTYERRLVTSFAPVERAPLRISILADRNQGYPRDVISYTIKVVNENDVDAELRDLTAILPAGFHCCQSQNGIVFSKEPVTGESAEGRTYRWDGPFFVGANDSVEARFEAFAPVEPGTYTTSAAASAHAVPVTRTNDWAVTVVPFPAGGSAPPLDQGSGSTNPAGQVTTPAVTAPSQGGTVAVGRDGDVRVPGTTVECPPGGSRCGASAVLAMSGSACRRGPRICGAAERSVTLGARRFNVPAGGRSRVVVRLSPTGRRIVRRLRRVRVSATITLRRGDVRTTRRVKFTLRSSRR